MIHQIKESRSIRDSQFSFGLFHSDGIQNRTLIIRKPDLHSSSGGWVCGMSLLSMCYVCAVYSLPLVLGMGMMHFLGWSLLCERHSFDAQYLLLLTIKFKIKRIFACICKYINVYFHNYVNKQNIIWSGKTWSFWGLLLVCFQWGAQATQHALACSPDSSCITWKIHSYLSQALWAFVISDSRQ